jgi:hypothetical protein
MRLSTYRGEWLVENAAQAIAAFRRMHGDAIAKREAEHRRAFTSTADVPVPRLR